MNTVMKQNLYLFLIVVILIAAPLIIFNSVEYEGTDDKAAEAVGGIAPNYEPWLNPIWEPPGDSVESFLFALQAALGSGVVFYLIGYTVGRNRQNQG